MSRAFREPINFEREFGLHELFFSITDLKGLILSGNSVFQRVAGFEESELVGAPHNIIRHPDMPKIVFKLLWDTIKAKQPICAFVKNMAKDGGYYWVFATVLPIEDYYISIRLKPSTELIKIVAPLYAQLLDIEKKSGTAACLAPLQDALKSLGFANYQEFMVHALIEEMKSRDASLSKTSRKTTCENIYSDLMNIPALRQTIHNVSRLESALHPLKSYFEDLFKELGNFLNLNSELKKKSQYLRRISEEVRIFSMNTILQSQKMGDTAKTLGAISGIMRQNTDVIASQNNQILKKINNISQTMKLVIFEILFSKLQIEMMGFFLKEDIAPLKEMAGTERARAISQLQFNLRLLVKALNRSASASKEAIHNLNSDMHSLLELVRSIQGAIEAAELVHVTGSIESSRFEKAVHFMTLFDEVKGRVKQARQQIENFELLIGHFAQAIQQTEINGHQVDSAFFEIDQLNSKLSALG